MMQRNSIAEIPLANAQRRVESGVRAESVFESAIYEGWVRHRRFSPHAHSFRYRVCMVFIDLSETDRLFERRRFWSKDRRNVAEFRRSDFLGDPEIPLDTAVRERVRIVTGVVPRGPIRLLTHLRYFGYSFNPVSFYYCYSADGRRLETIVAEITNTPWKERHSYVLPITSAEKHGSSWRWDFRKQFHVSPFLPMDREYSWRFTAPNDELRVHMDVMKDVHRQFDATLVLRRRAWNSASLARVLIRYPLMTLRIVAAIHWQALLIFLRRNPVYAHPESPGT